MSSIFDGLDLLAASQSPNDGKPLQIPLALIDEDPEQPRKEFDSTALAELAETIRERGVKTPISVRAHPELPGRWVLNFGSRRLRASKLAERTQIPAFVDACADNYDQVIENEQREPLTPLELALFVQRRQTLGETQKEIGRRLGKSQPYVMYAGALIDAPDWLMAAYREGRCRGIKELYELRRLHREHPQHVENWISGDSAPAVTRRALGELRDRLASASTAPTQTSPDRSPPHPGEVTSEGEGVSTSPARTPGATLGAAPVSTTLPTTSLPPERSSKPPASMQKLQAEAGGVVFSIDIHRVPAEPGMLFVTPRDGGDTTMVPASTLKLLGFDRTAE